MRMLQPDFRISVDREKCRKCGRCVFNCGFGALSLKEVIVAEAEKCAGCHRCVSFCPEQAITVELNPLSFRPNDNWTPFLIKAIYKQAESGGILLASMGNDKPWPIINDRLLLDACQVTNPSIDPLREPMELRTFLGRRPEKVEFTKDNGKWRMKTPVPATLKVEVPVLFAPMSYGSISYNAFKALCIAAKELDTLMYTGEGGLPRELYPYGDHIILQVASGWFGVQSEYLNIGVGTQIKIGQGAKPGIGGHLPGEKIPRHISETRMIPEGTDALSPAPQHDIYSIEDLSGMPYKNYFFPPLAGVAFSKNLYVWNDRIDGRKGMVRLVFGLGTRAVNRVGGDYPRMVAVSHPMLRPETGRKIARYSQHNIDVLDLKGNRFATLAADEVLEGTDYPGLNFLVSVFKEDFPEDPYSSLIDAPAQSLVLTFNNLLAKTGFVQLLGELLSKLERVYGYPIDTEFTAFVEQGAKVRVNLLQCRPMKLPGAGDKIKMPAKVPSSKILFRSERMINGGVVENIAYILFIDPRTYARIGDENLKKSLGRVVGMVNRHPKVAAGKIIMLGPGRWGSNDLNLGVNVSYADIDNASALVELALEEAGHRPEVSYGTHFFQDLVENNNHLSAGFSG